MVVAAGGQAAVVDDVLGVAVVVRVDLPSAPLLTRRLFAAVAQILIGDDYGCGVGDANEIGFAEPVELDCLFAADAVD